MVDQYQWRVIFTDGTSTTEYDDERPDGRGFAEIEEKPIRAIMLSDRYSVIVPEDAQPFFTRRRTLEVNLAEGTQETTTQAHVTGWKRDDSAVYLFVFADGSTLLTDDLQAV